jgi:lipoprotein-releasing system permease protein
MDKMHALPLPVYLVGSFIRGSPLFQPLPLYIGLRYVRTRRRGFFVSFISWVSMLGVCLGVAALIVILSVMNGFESELRDRLLNVSSHATLSGTAEQMRDWQALARQARTVPGVQGVAPYVELQGMLGRSGDLTGVTVRGIDPAQESQVSDLASHVVAGSAELPANAGRVLLGSTLAWQLQVQVGDEVTVLIPDVVEGTTELRPRLQSFVVGGIFEFGAQEQDSALALINLNEAESLTASNAPTGMRLKFNDLFAAPELVRTVNKALGGQLHSSDWTIENASYFRAVKIEKTMMAIMLMLIVAIAAFNIIAALVMVVNEKRTDIAILRTLGLTPGQVVAAFITQGLLIGWVGIFAGMCLGLVLAENVHSIVPWIESTFGVHFFDPTVYYITQIPSEIHAEQVLVIGAIALLLTAAATIYPARRGAAVAPAEALRYE